MKTTITLPLPPEATNGTHARCPECGGTLRDASAGGVPGDVACNQCHWTARWLATRGEIVGEPGPSEADFEVTTPAFKIPEHYDPDGIITADDDPAEEFARWQEFAKSDPDWKGTEFTLADFETYIGNLNQGKACH